MDKITDKRIKNYIKKIKKIFNAEIWLFGSRTKKDYFKESDYDLCVISKKFEGWNISKRLQKLYELMIENPFNADILAVTPQEFQKLSKTLTIYRDIKNKGIKLKFL